MCVCVCVCVVFLSLNLHNKRDKTATTIQVRRALNDLVQVFGYSRVKGTFQHDPRAWWIPLEVQQQTIYGCNWEEKWWSEKSPRSFLRGRQM